MKEIRDAEGNFEGLDGRECGEHRTLGERAWCFSCSTYCAPKDPCPGCEVPEFRAENERLRKALQEIAGALDDPTDLLAVAWAAVIAREALEEKG